MKRHILTNYGLTLCCLKSSEIIPNEEEICSQCHHVAVMIFKGHKEFLEPLKRKTINESFGSIKSFENH